LHLFNIPAHSRQVDEPFIPLGALRRLTGIEHRDEFGCHAAGIHHLVLGSPGMYTIAGKCHMCTRGIETLILEFAFRAAVHGIGKIGPEAVDIEVMRPAPYLFIRRECHTYLTVSYFI